MTEAYAVGTPALTGHAGVLADLAGELSSALAAAQVSVTADAYGQAGARLAAGLADVAGTGQATLQSGIEALDRAAAAMRATVTAYEKEERTGRDAYEKIGGERS